MSEDRLKILVSSTVYNSESDLDQIKYILLGFGYDVQMSKEGNIYVGIDDSPSSECMKAVEDCDLFLSIIFPRYGSGITHEEFKHAVKLNKPRWFIAHRYIEYTRKLMEQFMFDKNKVRNDFDIKKTSVLDSLRVIDMYNDVRKKWVQPFFNTSEIQIFIETQFKDYGRRQRELRAGNNE